MRAKTRTYLDTVVATIEGMRTYWPLTLRQVYYQLVAALVIENTKNTYKRLSDLLSDARFNGELPWESMEDRSRVYLASGGWQSKSTFADQEMRGFLEGYRRDLLQDQPARLELWSEKDAVSRIAHAVALDYCVPVIAARGFASTSFKNECRKRILWNYERGQQTIILYFGDLDPSGWEMLPAMMRTFRETMDLSEQQVISRRCALNLEQVEQYRLPHSIGAVKEGDSRTPKYRQLFGDLAVELDALRPDLLADIVRRTIEQNLDMALFQQQQAAEQRERDELATIKRSVKPLIQDSLQI